MRKEIVAAVLAIGACVIVAVVSYRTADYGNLYTREYPDVYSDALAKRQPADIQKDLKIIFEQLIVRPDADLFVLKSSEEPCLLEELIFCRLIPSEKVKPFIEAALAYKQDAQSREMSRGNNLISVGGLLVSFFSLIVAGLSFAYRKRAS
jgi:hypothetical protein